jgi:hypothetical protein
MSPKGTAPEADLLRVPVPRSRSAKLAQLFVEWTSQQPLKVIVAFVILTALSGLYVVRHFSINTDVNALISADLPWRQRELIRFSAKHTRNPCGRRRAHARASRLRGNRFGRSALETR